MSTSHRPEEVEAPLLPHAGPSSSRSTNGKSPRTNFAEVMPQHSRSSSRTGGRSSTRSKANVNASRGSASLPPEYEPGEDGPERAGDLVVHDSRSMRLGPLRSSSEKFGKRERMAREYELQTFDGEGEEEEEEEEESDLRGVTRQRDDDGDYLRDNDDAPLLHPSSRRRPSDTDLDPELALHRSSRYPSNPSEPANVSAKSTLSSAIFNMSNSILGAGIIGLPFAISEAGFFTGVFLLVALCAVTDWTIRLIVIDAKMSGRESYIGIMEFCFGWWGRVGVSFFQFAFALGGMCANGVIIGDTIPSVIRYLFPSLLRPGAHPFLAIFADRRFVIFLATAFVSYPLSLNKDIAKLSKASGMALVSMFVIVASVVIRGPLVDDDLRGSSEGMFSIIEPKVFEAIGVMSFAYVCHHNSLLIYGSLHTPTLDRFNAVTHASTGMALICCLVMSLAGYLSFRSKTEGNILNNFPQDDFVINIARLCFGLNMFTTVPLEAFVCREVVEELFFEEHPFSLTRHVVVTTALVGFTMSVAMVTCDLGIVLEITGGLSATALAYLFPPMAYCKLTKGPWYSRQKLPATLCAVFGMVVLVLSLLLTIRKAVTGEGHSDKVCL